MRKFTKAAAMLCAAAMVIPSASVFAAEDGGVLHFLPDSDLTSLFCNLLDNAMEAAGKVQIGRAHV